MSTNNGSKHKTAHQQNVELMRAKIASMVSMPSIPSVPSIPDPSLILKQAKLLFEETLEVLAACGVAVRLTDDVFWAEENNPLHIKQFTLTLDRLPDISDLPHIAKELADVSVVNTGMFSEFGLSDIPILEEVDAANIRKFIDGCYIDENKKLRKSPNYIDVDLTPVLAEQGYSVTTDNLILIKNT